MAVITIRGLDEDASKLLKKEAKKKGISENIYVLKLIKEALGFEKKGREIIHRDLDNLAGTWSESDYKEFKKNVVPFEVIDKDMWK